MIERPSTAADQWRLVDADAEARRERYALAILAGIIAQGRYAEHNAKQIDALIYSQADALIAAHDAAEAENDAAECLRQRDHEQSPDRGES